MAKKYSKYNVYQGCANMCNLKEAIEAIDAGEYTDENMYELEARITLYNKLFGGISNTEAQKRNFNERKEFILRKQTDDEKEEYLVNLQNAIAELEEEASKEFLERTNDINLGSTAGKEAGTPAYDKKTSAGTSAQMTRYSKLNNLPVPLNYKCTDEGVFVYSNTEYDYVRICQAVSINTICFDDETNTQYIELQYYKNENITSVTTFAMPSEELANGKYNQLIKTGFSICNQKAFTRFINDLRTCGITNKMLEIKKAALSYGYPEGEDGGFDFTKFIGIDEDCKILPSASFESYDKKILHSKGTLEEYIEFLTEISRGYYQIDFQMVVAASLSGIVQAYITENSGKIAPGVYLFAGRNSIGKNILANIANSIWSLEGKNTLIANSDDSASNLAAVKDRFKILPLIIADIQDLMNKKDGILELAQTVFAHSIGTSAGRATTTGEVRNNKKQWFNNLICFNENDVFTHNSKLNGGASARLVVLPLGILKKDRWLTEKDPSTYMSLQDKSAGVLGKAFVLGMREKNQEEIKEMYYKTILELKKDFDVQEKQAASLAMLILADYYAMEMNLLPVEWEPLTAKRLIDWIGGAKKVADMNEELYNLLSELAFKDPSYVANDDASWEACVKINGSEQAAFDSRMKDKNEVRGRKLYQKKNASGDWEEGTSTDHDRCLLLIPKHNLKQLLTYIETTSGIVGAGFDPRTWAANGWLLPSSPNIFTHKDTFKISVTFQRNSKRRENYYAIPLKEDDDEDAARVYEENCLKTMKASLSIDAEVNRKICETCTDERCAYKRKDA